MDEAAEQNHRDLASSSRVGEIPTTEMPNLSCSLTNVPANVARFMAPPGPIIYSVRWQRDSLLFTSHGRKGEGKTARYRGTFVYERNSNSWKRISYMNLYLLSSSTIPLKSQLRSSLRSLNIFLRWHFYCRILTLLLAVFSAAGVCIPETATGRSKPLSKYLREEWGSEKGFPGGTINVITQTLDGYLWLGTQKGLVRFDGLNSRMFSQTTGGSPWGRFSVSSPMAREIFGFGSGARDCCAIATGNSTIIRTNRHYGGCCHLDVPRC